MLRNYAREYKNYQGLPKSIKERASRNKARKIMVDKLGAKQKMLLVILFRFAKMKYGKWIYMYWLNINNQINNINLCLLL